MSARLRGSKRYITVAEFSRLTGLSVGKVRYDCEHGHLRVRPGHVPGQHWEILRRELTAELSRQGRG